MRIGCVANPPKVMPKCSQASTAAQRPGREVTMRSHLRNLARMTSPCVVIARRINRVDFDAEMVLKAHFSTYGIVENVLVPKSVIPAKPRKESDAIATCGRPRLRPHGTGFIVMRKAEAVNAILAAGSEHVVQGVTVTLQRFRQHPVDSALHLA